MSIESAKAFIERIKTDADFASKVSASANAHERMALVKAAGFDFTAAEMDALKQELTDSELERVTGGGIGDGDHPLFEELDPQLINGLNSWLRRGPPIG